MSYDSLGDMKAEEPSSVLVIPMYSNILAVPNDRPGPCTDVNPPFGPPWCGQYEINGTWFYSTEPAPTAAHLRPGYDDKVYISTLAGVLWTEPVAQVLEYDLNENGYPVGEGRAIADGFWAIVDFVFFGEDTLFVLELNPAGFVPFSGGRLTKVDLQEGTMQIVAESDQLYNPTGIVIEDDMIYINNNTLVPCDGHILKASLMTLREGIGGGLEDLEDMGFVEESEDEHDDFEGLRH